MSVIPAMILGNPFCLLSNATQLTNNAIKCLACARDFVIKQELLQPVSSFFFYEDH